MKMFSFFSKKAGVSLLVTATFVLSIVAALFGQSVRPANEGMWTAVEESSLDQSAKRLLVPSVYQTMRLNQNALLQTLASAPMEFTRDASQNPIIFLPMPDGTLARFRFEKSPVVEAGLSAKYPGLDQTYRAQGIDDPTATCRFDWLPTGFHAIILSPSGTVLIDPYAEGNTTDYITYWKRDAANLKHPFTCDFQGSDLPDAPARNGIVPNVLSGGTLRTYRLALAATNEYCVAVGGNTISGSLAAEVLIMNRVNGVYERDLSMRMTIIANNNLITYAGDNNGCGGPCNSGNDPYTNGSGGTMLGQNQTTCTNVIGSANYDIGHVFSTGGGGIAGLGVPCINGSKAQGVTGLPSPLGDPFAIDYVAHEMGHQWGADHTFNGTSGNCSGNRSGSHAYETGSGITIMSYAGICDAQNLAAHSIDTFHLDSLNAIVAYTQGGTGDSCDVPSSTGNNPPNLTGTGNFNIPKQTPFTLTASATDPNGDSITYDWQEFDLGASTTAVPNTDSDGNARPIFRPYLPTVSGTRTFPSLQYIASFANVPPSTSGGFLTGELLPAISRTMNFQVVARDNRANGGGINSATSLVIVSAGAGPFAVTAPNTAVSITGGTNSTVTWNVANSTAAPVSAANVKISISTDGANSFPTVLAASTANDGSESVTIPNTPTSFARIKVEAVGNIFFDISDTNFTITAGPTPTPAPTPTPTPTATPITVSLPIANFDTTVPIGTNIIQPVNTTVINPTTTGGDNYVGFQGDFTFDSTVATFGTTGPGTGAFVQAAGLTATNWNVTGSILPGGGPTSRILRISGFSNDFTPLSGSGLLFNLKMFRVSSTGGATTALTWKPSPDHFTFTDDNLNTHNPITPAGSITITSPATPTPSPVVATVSLPIATIDTSVTNFVQPVVTTAINPVDDLIGFQGDFTFDSAIVSFTTPQVSAAGLTSSNWNVSSNILNTGPGTIKTLRISAFSLDFTPLSGSGTLFNLNMTRVSSTSGAVSPLIWNPAPDNFYYINGNLDNLAPGSTPSGSITIQGSVDISGTVIYCSNPALPPVPGVTMSLTGPSPAPSSTPTNGSGVYSLLGLTSGASYTVTPTKTALVPGTSGINTSDAVAIQRHFLGLGTPLTGCRLAAADTNDPPNGIGTTDAIAAQRFFLGLTSGIAQTGRYKFTPASISYSPLTSTQTGQNYNVVILGDAATGFVAPRPAGGPSLDAAIENEVASTVASVALPDVTLDQTKSNFTAAVTTSNIEEKSNLVGFQGDFTFDERVVIFESQPVSNAGLTATNWNVSGNVLAGPGPIRTLRISAFSLDGTPLSGIGALFNLNMVRVDKTRQSTSLVWAPAAAQFVFIDADLNTQKPGNAAPGSVVSSVRTN